MASLDALKVSMPPAVKLAAANARGQRSIPTSSQPISLSTPSASQQPPHSPHDENQCRNRDNCERHKVANGIGKNVIRMSRIEAIEVFKGGWQRC